MLSGREAIKRLLSGKDRERVGLMEHPWGDTLASWVGQGYPVRTVHRKAGESRFDLLDGKTREAATEGDYPEPVPPWEHFGYDLVGVGGWFDVMPRRGVSDLMEETDEWEVRRNGAGAALKYWKHKSGTPEHIDFLMTERGVWERDYRPRLMEFDPLRLKIDDTRKAKEEAEGMGRWTHYGHIFVWELMRQSMGDITLYENLLLDPGWIRDFCRVYTDFYKAYFRALIAQAGKPDGIWFSEDLGYGNGLFTSPRVLADLVFPSYAEIVSWFHEQGLPVVLHSCGSVVDALPLILEAGFDGLNPMERKARGNDPFEFAERHGDRLVFFGGLDARVFESNDRALIEREVAAYMDGMKSRGARLVFGSDHSISPLTRYDSYRWALDVYRKHMMY